MLSKLRVLVAEGHQDMCQMLVPILNAKFEIIGAVNNGEDLVDAAISLYPDVIVSDVSMPRLSGPQAMQRLSTRGYSIPFVFVSSDSKLLEGNTGLFANEIDAHSELVAAVEAVALRNDALHATSFHKDTPSRIMRDYTNKHPRNQVSLTYKLGLWILYAALAWIVLGLTLWGILWLCHR
jgi:CheY-like chemotaxis protein